MISIKAFSPFSKSKDCISNFDRFIKSKSFISKETFDSIQLKINDIINDLEKDESNFYSALIYGQVQSGKTLFFTSLMIKLIEKYKNPTFIILSNNNKNLLNQTFDRISGEFKIIGTKLNKCKFSDYKDMRYFTAQNIKEEPSVFFCLKEKENLNQLINFFKNNFCSENIFIIDDEADVASISFKDKNDSDAGVIANKMKELIKSMQSKKISYFAITATPFDNMLLPSNDFLKPQYIYPLDINDNYFGLSKFSNILNSFSNDVIINRFGFDIINPNYGLKENLVDAVISFFIQWFSIEKKQKKIKPLMLINSPIEIEKQQEIKVKIISLFNSIYYGEIDNRISDLIDNFFLDVNLKEFKQFIKTIELKKNLYINTLNSSDESMANEQNLSLDYETEDFAQIIIGFNKVSRGITFKGLTSCYLDSGTEQKTISLLLQQARWFGYRKDFIKNLIIWIPEYYIDDYISICDIVNYQFFKLKTDKSYEFNSIYKHFSKHKSLQYSRFVDKNINFKKNMWCDENIFELDSDNSLSDDKILKTLKLFSSTDQTIVNKNKVIKISNVNKLLEILNLKNESDFFNLLSKYSHCSFSPEDKNLFKKYWEKNVFIRLINWDENKNKIESHDRKVITIDCDVNNKIVSLHNYTDEYNDDFVDSITIDVLKIFPWEYKNYKKIRFLTNPINKIIIRVN